MTMDPPCFAGPDDVLGGLFDEEQAAATSPADTTRTARARPWGPRIKSNLLGGIFIADEQLAGRFGRKSAQQVGP